MTVNFKSYDSKKLDKINLVFSEKFGSNWIKVKFYEEFSPTKRSKILKDIRFCEAMKEALVQPVFLNKESISCPGARYVLGWDLNDSAGLLESCSDKHHLSKKVLGSLLSQIPHIKKPFQYVGLNTDGEPDLVMAYMLPEQVMNIIKSLNSIDGKNLELSLNFMMPICGGIAVRTYLMKEISLSFGCIDSRKYSHMSRARLAIGIPKESFDKFLSSERVSIENED
jgi:uncharacterized protein (DUF169 family)